MTVANRHAQYSLEQYVRLEEYSNVKHEFLDGQIYAVAGGTPEHGAMAMRIGAALITQLRGRRCNVYSSDVRVRVTATGLDTYPDVSVVCGDEARDDNDKNALTNPVVLVEVLSPTTHEYDRGEKLDHYKRIRCLQEVVLVCHREELIEVWRRGDGDKWTRQEARAGDTARIASIDCSLEVDEMFRDPLARP